MMSRSVKTLRKSYRSCFGRPVLSAVDTSIFALKYFTRCLQCTFCNDWCCSDGVDLDSYNVRRILEHADELQTLVSIPLKDWFESEVTQDAEMPGGLSFRTNAVNGSCVFLNREQRGCVLQQYAKTKGIDYHYLKPLVSAIYPLTFENGILLPADEVEDQSLVCMGSGLSLYRGARDELGYYFGPSLLEELDQIETQK